MMIGIIFALLSTPLRSGQLYLDPGSGSFILQILVASLLGALFVVKAYWKKIVNFIRRREDDTEDPEE